MEDIKVSVIITTYKRSDMLERAIESVLNQTYKNIEVVVVDDNDSSSNHRKETSKIMQKYSSNLKVKYIKHEKNKNGAAARNTGIQNSSGMIVTFLDDDDWYLEEKVEKQVNYLLTNKEYKAVYCGWHRDKEIISPTLKGDLTFELLSGRNIIYTNAIMMWKDIILEFGGWDERFLRNQEAVFLLRFFKKGYKIGVIPNVLVEFDISDRSNALNGKKNEEAYKFYLSEHEDMIEKCEQSMKNARKNIYCYRYRGILLNYLKNKEITNCIKIYIKMIMNYPIMFNKYLIIYIYKRILKVI